ncbi:hypothetical protein VUN82_10645 [Micrococcaceae bacterium Sec5.1]
MITAATRVAMYLSSPALITDRGSALQKLGLIVLAGLNMIFHRGIYRVGT